MAIIPTPASLNGELQEIFRRLRNLENAPRGVTRSPSSVSGATAESLGFIDSTGIAQGVVRLSWVAPTVAVDGTPLTPDRYEVYGRQTVDSLGYPVTDPQWSLITTVDHPTTSAQAGPFSSQSTWEFRVRSVSKKGQRSDFVYLTIVIALDATVPPVPSTPLVASSLRTLSMTWDGKDSTGLLMPAAFAFVEVHLSLTSGFTPDATTLVDTLTGPGTIPRVQLALGQVVYVKFRAKSRTGVLSAATPQASITILGITGPDIEANSITSNEVNTGLLTAAMVRGDVMTSSLGTGARFRLSAADGLKLYNTSNALTFWADAATGNTLVTGIFKTAATGIRVEINNALWTAFSGMRLYDSSSNGSMAEVKVIHSGTQAGQLQLSSGAVVLNSTPSAQIELSVGGAWKMRDLNSAGETSISHDGSGSMQVTAAGNMFLTTPATGTIAVKTGQIQLQAPSGTGVGSIAISSSSFVIDVNTPALNAYFQATGSMVLDFGRSGAVETFYIRRNTANRFVIAGTSALLSASALITIDAGTGSVNMPHTVGTAATSSTANAFFGTTGNLVKSSVSSRRYKENIAALHYTREQFMALQPIRFDSRLEMDRAASMVGFIAEDLHEAGMTELVNYDELGRPDGISYGWITAPLVQQVQELIREVAELKERQN